MTEEDYRREIAALKEERRKQEEENHKALESRVTNLEDLAAKIYRQNENQSQDLARLLVQQERIDVSLNGTADEPEKGLKVRVDRLEERSRNTSWLSKTTLGALITAIIAWLFTSGK